MYMQRLAPPSDHYLHNDIHLRPQTDEDRRRVVANGWDVSDPATLEKWRAQEPFNAHSHLLAMMWGASECIPVRQPWPVHPTRTTHGVADAAEWLLRTAGRGQVSEGKLAIGQWQSVMLIDLDGPRTRTVGVQVVGVA